MKSNRRTRIGVIGAGMVAGWHLQRLAKLPVEIVGIHSRSPGPAVTLCDTYGGRPYDSADELLADVDVIDICTPTPHHKEYVLAAARAGKAVICEKPLANNLVDAEEMVEACRSAEVSLCVGHVVRFFPQYQAAKRLIDAGSLGTPGVLRATRGSSFPRPRGATWYSDPRQSGGVILDLALHDIDVGLWWLGPVERVFARGSSNRGEGSCDHALLTLRFASGAIGHIEASWSMPEGRFYNSFELSGTGGIAEWNGLDRGALEVHMSTKDSDDDLAVPDAGMVLDDRDDPYYAELAHFIDHVETESPLRVRPEEGLAALRVALAALQSLHTGEPVMPGELSGGNR